MSEPVLLPEDPDEAARALATARERVRTATARVRDDDLDPDARVLAAQDAAVAATDAVGALDRVLRGQETRAEAARRAAG